MQLDEVILAYPGDEALAQAVVTARHKASLGRVLLRRFPDGESYLRLLDPVRGASVTVVASLHQPDARLIPVMLLAATARDLGAARVTLLSPYLPYMRQDERFEPGEGVTSRYVAAMLSGVFDALATADPHLHRHQDLAHLYTIPTACLSTSQAIAAWLLKLPSPQLLLIGPDEESAQWVEPVASATGSPWVILSKLRRGDHDVSVCPEGLWPRHGQPRAGLPVILDDIISTGHTMAQTVRHVLAAGLDSPLCVGVHAVFAQDALALLRQAGAQDVVTCNTIPHPSNQIDVCASLAAQYWAWRAQLAAEVPP